MSLPDRGRPEPAAGAVTAAAGARLLSGAALQRVRRPARSLVLAGGLVLLVAGPVLTLIALAVDPDAGWDTLRHLATTVLPRYAAASVALALVVLAVVLSCGVTSGWLIAAYRFPGHRMLSWALMLPLAMPAFVMAYAYTDFLDTSGPLQSALRRMTGLAVGEYWFPDIRSLPVAGLMLGLALYPYVYMLARTAFTERSASLSEAALSLGVRRALVWYRVIWPVARPAVAAGCALVLMETLADFGTVSYFAVDTLTAGIYRAWQGLGDRVTAARLAMLLLLVVGLLVWVERRQRVRMRYYARSTRPAAPQALKGLRAAVAWVACVLPVLFGFVVPALLLVRLWLASGAQVDPRLLVWLGNTAMVAAASVMVLIPVAVAVAYADRLARRPALSIAIALAGAGYAVPGLVLGIGLLGWIGAIDRALGALVLGGTVVAVVYAYCVRFFSVAYQGIEAGLKRISPSMDQSARTLGLGPFGVLARVHWPLMRRSVAACTILLLVDCLKELPATLVLRPFDFDTLAVVAYHFAADERLAEAAAPALVIVAISTVPILLLSRGWLDKVD